MKNNNSHKQPGLRLPLLPAPPGCGGPVPRGALPPDGVRRPRKGLQAKGVFLCPGRALGSPIPGGDTTARGDPRALGKGGPAARTFPSWGSRPGMETGGRETVPQGWAPRSFPGSCRTDLGMSETPRAKPQVRGGGAPSVPKGTRSSRDSIAPPAPGASPGRPCSLSWAVGQAGRRRGAAPQPQQLPRSLFSAPP